jgi:hypothetical protein
VTAEPALIPWPSQLTTTGDEHVLHERTRIVAAPEVEPVAELSAIVPLRKGQPERNLRNSDREYRAVDG